MKITVICGTPVKGVTYHMKEMFLQNFGSDAEFTQFYPDDRPPFCLGCKSCFLRGEELCPHRDKTAPIWQSLLSCDLIVFAYPVYALRAPASIKSLLDHLCVHWLVHRPEPELFKKTAVIITNSVGAPNGSAQKDVKTSLSWMGVSKVYTCGAGMMGDILWESITPAHEEMLRKKMLRLYKRTRSIKPVKHMHPKESLQFLFCHFTHKMVMKGETQLSPDTRHYIAHGWIKSPR